jgi:hypothetical protein
MFLGVRPSQDWNRTDPIEEPTLQEFDFLCRVRGNEQNCPNAQNEAQLPGVWPAVVVVVSNDVFNVVRSTDRPCRITEVNNDGRSHIYEYLAQAAQQDIPIIIRLASPGNFRDAVDLGPPHTLILAPSETPQIGGRNRTYCDADREGRDGDSGYKSFRSIDDLLNEMGSILGLLDVDDRFNLDNIYFLPANEPNGEWYGPGWWTWSILRATDPDNIERLHEIDAAGAEAWDDMNRFFSALYRRKEERARENPASAFSQVNILTPPMGQGKMAEPFEQDCVDTILLGPPDPETREQEEITTSGYERMLLDYADTLDVQEGMLQPALNDGYTWNNYWEPGNWADDNPNNNWEQWGETCDGEAGPPQPPEKYHYHVFQFFPFQMRLNVRDASPDEETELAIITEADVFSPYQYGSLDQSPIQSKDTNNGLTASDSIHDFVVAETEFDPQHGADYIALWNLTVDHSPDASVVEPDFTTCTEMNPANLSFDEGAGRAHHELQWHMGYLVEGEVCAWFDRAWQATSPRAPGASWAAVETTP